MQIERARLKHYLENDPSLRFYVAKGVSSGTRLAGVSPGEEIDFQSINSFVVAYPSGEVLEEFGSYGHLPEGLFFMEGPVYKDSTEGYRRGSVDNSKVKISNSRCVRRPDDPTYYSTTIQNTGTTRVRVYKFAPLSKIWGLFYPREPHPGYYSPRQFIEWFRVGGDDGWIAPGESVEDPDNYGFSRGIWVFFFEEEEGGRFIATCPLDGVK